MKRRTAAAAMTMRTSAETGQSPGPAVCWCCGTTTPVQLVHLGEHPEVTVCAGCAHFLSKSAWELEDRGRAGLAVRARDRLRQLRGTVIAHGWHDHSIMGPALRWIGRFTP